MTSLFEPYEDDPDVMAVDAALDALARRRPVVADPALSALAVLAQTIDTRVAALEADGEPTDVVGSRPRPVSRPRASRRRRFLRGVLAIPVAAAAVVVVSTLPFNEAPGSPLHPLHQLFFQPDDGAADVIRTHLASASQALDDATGTGASTREAGLEQARHDLDEARRRLAQVADAGTRAELEQQLSKLERRAKQLADVDDDQGAGPGEGGQGQDNGNGATAGATPSPTNGDEDNQGQSGKDGQHQGT